MPSKRIEQTRSSKTSGAFEQRYVLAAQLAARWSVSKSAIHHGNCGSHALTPIRLGRSVRFLLSEVEAFEKKHEAQTRRNDSSDELI